MIRAGGLPRDPRPAAAHWNRILAFRLTTFDPGQLRRFYVDGIGFREVGTKPISSAEMSRLNLDGEGARTTLMLADQVVDLDCFERPGRPYPPRVQSSDLLFQHFAIVVADIAAAYARALEHGAAAISSAGPVPLPARSGGLTAVKFRDPEGHPLEFLEFPPGSSSPWLAKAAGRSGALGIDHSAISVADAEVSCRFYEAHGLNQGARTLNQGPAQARLDGLAEPCVEVVPLLPSDPFPHLELLGYRTPLGHPIGAIGANDSAATRIVWQTVDVGLIRDPDGHLHQLERSL